MACPQTADRAEVVKSIGIQSEKPKPYRDLDGGALMFLGASWSFERAHGRSQILIVHHVVPIEHRPGAVPGHPHHHRLGDAVLGHQEHGPERLFRRFEEPLKRFLHNCRRTFGLRSSGTSRSGCSRRSRERTALGQHPLQELDFAVERRRGRSCTPPRLLLKPCPAICVH
jgi:hypothetical protein